MQSKVDGEALPEKVAALEEELMALKSSMASFGAKMEENPALLTSTLWMRSAERSFLLPP